MQENSFASQELSAGGDQISTLSDESEDNENIYRPVRMLRKVSVEMPLFECHFKSSVYGLRRVHKGH